ncbi:GNAT family N-acetyltransferase [Jeotgalibacillus sp. S-D1]|uniref:GNAT family N-acetyltransferase n=1 Tax=Jeotgalibacillus sp. S-D1 TaxID=2552189 RepID=UPI001059953A|nr:GNAT family N-acetyltransferase [Jeotgalibacillus sp. S-D1]TDL35293.1 GNAT family N-acetyltransferase [Jeotgalibacillus sp. S-D1]
MRVVHALTEQDKQIAFALRKAVFVEEQGVPEEEELDELDSTSEHFLLYAGNEPIGAGRFRSYDNAGKFERICILSSHRGKGAGSFIMKEIERFAGKNGFQTLRLNAQTQALSFYEKLGYRITSEEFSDAGIPHRAMEKVL